MSNPYFVFTPRFIPGTKVRAAAVNTQYDRIEDAFDLLPADGDALTTGKPTVGIESGSSNAYVVTMPNTRIVNAEGDEVVFKATHQNSGASTLQVDSIASVPLVRYNGDALSAGDILVGTYYVARYNQTAITFEIIAPTQATVVGSITYVTPTGLVKLAASAGSATSLIRSDADIALDQSIVPTWTGAHTFNAPVTFNSTVSGAVFSSAATFADGTALLPGIAFTLDTNTGIYRVGADDLGITTGGTLRWDVSTTAITSTLQQLGAAGLVGTPTYSFSGDPNTGIYSAGADILGMAVGGVLNFFVSSTLTVSIVPFRGPVGAVGAPTFTFSGDTDTGIYRIGADDVGIATAGTLRFDVSTTTVTSTLPLAGPVGAVGTPTFTFAGDLDTGIYHNGANTFNIAVGGAPGLQIDATGNYSYFANYAINNGTVGAPQYSWNADPDTGIYRIGADNIGVALAGSSYLNISTSTLQYNGTAILTGATGTGTGGNYRSVDDGGTSRWLAGILGSAAERNYYIYELSAGVAALTVLSSNRQLLAQNGAVATPIWSFVNDQNTGIYSYAADAIGFAAGGSLVFYMGSTAIQFEQQLQADFTSSAGTPAFSFGNDTNTGIYRVGADDLGITTGGTLRFDISTTAVTSTLPIRPNDGTGSLPSHAFASDASSGMSLQSGTALLLSYLGSSYMSITTGAVAMSSSAQFQAFAGSAGTPGISFNADTDTGFYRDTANQIAIALGGSTAGQIAQGSFTGTLTGYAAGPTGTVNWQRIGNMVFMYLTAQISGTSNATSMTMTGVPAAIQPAGNYCAGANRWIDNTASILGTAQISGGTITFATGVTCNVSGFTASGTKGLAAGFLCAYSIA